VFLVFLVFLVLLFLIFRVCLVFTVTVGDWLTAEKRS
jgi:hypothetical protein